MPSGPAPAKHNPPPLRVVHVTPWLSRRGGGVSAALWGFADHAAATGVEPIAAGLRDPDFDADTADHPAVRSFGGAIFGPRSRAYSPQLGRFLRDLDQVDVLHVHGLRHWPGVAARREAQRRGVPLVISTHGMLYPWLLHHALWRKWLTAASEAANFRAAAMVHATCLQELQYIRNAVVTAPVAVVPLGVDVAEFDPADDDDRALTARWPELVGKKRLTYLGLMDRKKGLPRLAAAWGALHGQFPGWQLVLAGPMSGRYLAEVQIALHAAGVPASSVTFTGPVYGPWKRRLLRAADLFVLPSDWENFGIAIAEALACEAPAIAMRTAPWEELAGERCGWWIEPGVESLTATLRQAMSLDDAARKQMGRRGRQLIEQRYARPALAAQLRQAYDFARGGAKPEFVYRCEERSGM